MALSKLDSFCTFVNRLLKPVYKMVMGRHLRLLPPSTAFIWAVAFKPDRNGGVADCFRRVRRAVQSGLGAGSDTASCFAPSCS